MSLENSITSFNPIRQRLFPSFVLNSPYIDSFNKPLSFQHLGPASPNMEWITQFKRWELIVHLNGGTIAMQEAGRKYLPQEKGEKGDIYKARLQKTVLYGAYSRTVKTLSELPFIVPVQAKNLPSELEYLMEEADCDGQSIERLGQQVLKNLMDYGIAHIMVEYPETPEDFTLLDQREMNIRPYICNINPMNFVGWQYEQVGSKNHLTQARIFEDTFEKDPENEWSSIAVRKVRVIENGTVRVYSTKRNENKEEFVLIDQYPNDLGRINIITLYGNKTGFMQGSPVLEELAWQNLRHYQKLSDLDNIEHICNVPFAFGKGIPEEDMNNVVISPHMFLKTTATDADISYVEHSGSAIGASQQSIRDLESRMVAMGADLLAARGTSTRETATSKLLDNTKSTSYLQSLVLEVEKGLVQAFQMAGEWIDVSAENLEINIGDKLNLSVDPNVITSLIGLAKEEALTYEDLTMELQRRGHLSESTKLKKPKKELIAPMGAINAPIAPNQGEDEDARSLQGQENQGEGQEEEAQN